MRFNHYLLPLTLLFFAACTIDQEPTDPVTSIPQTNKVVIEQQPVHYKYAEKITHSKTLDHNHEFDLSIEVDQTEVAVLHFDSESYPVILKPGSELKIQINKADFPKDVSIDGYSENWNEKYQQYLADVTPIEQQIRDELPDFREGRPNLVLDLHLERIQLAERDLGDTPLVTEYYANIGEYLNRALQNVRYKSNTDPDFDAVGERQRIFRFAHDHDFFTYESLKAQRAGIRDFAHNYAMSFDVQDSLRNIYGEQLSDQDIKRLGYERLNSYREEVLDQITERSARAYAEMHIIAKRLGEMPLEVGEPGYENFLAQFGDYEEYTRFLKEFYEEMRAVSPGQPAVPFTLPNPDGEMISMSDFSGKYVLLDFWASWCVPCLDEFPDMRRIYENTSRDEFEIVAISTEADSLVWRRALERFENPWVQLYGGNEFQQETFVEYRGGGIPFYILINPEGNIERYNDIRATHNLEEVLDSLLTHKPPE